jgi:hypothetical protein
MSSPAWSAGLAHVETVRMPANNLLLVFEKRVSRDTMDQAARRTGLVHGPIGR